MLLLVIGSFVSVLAAATVFAYAMTLTPPTVSAGGSGDTCGGGVSVVGEGGSGSGCGGGGGVAMSEGPGGVGGVAIVGDGSSCGGGAAQP